MKIGRILHKGNERFCVFEPEEGKAQLTDAKSILEVQDAVQVEALHLRDLRFLTPTLPSKIICVGLNYKDHAKELIERELLESVPNKPVIFLKPPSSLLPHFGEIEHPAISKRVDYEAELAVVVGKGGRNIEEKKAGEHILGHSCFNDVTARDLQKEDGQWTRAKSFDAFSPYGPWVETEADVSDAKIECLVNGEVKQSSRTSQLIFNLPKLIEFISSIMTLLPGDVIATGTPAGVGVLERGDSVEVSIDGIGKLVNLVR